MTKNRGYIPRFPNWGALMKYVQKEAELHYNKVYSGKGTQYLKITSPRLTA
jgi:hypothetical protein